MTKSTNSKSIQQKHEILFTFQPHLFRTQVVFIYDSHKHVLHVYESTKLDEFIDKIESKLSTRNVKFQNNDQSFISQQYYSMLPLTTLVNASLENIFINDQEYIVQKTSEQIISGNRRDDEQQTLFVILDEFCRLRIAPSWS